MPGPPQWSGVNQWSTIDDPRWKGAARQSFPNFVDASNDASLRSLSFENTLYLSLQAMVDPDANTMEVGPPGVDWDSVFVGFRNPTTGQVSIAELDAKGLNQGDPHTILAARHWQKANDAAAPADSVGSPAWASDLRLWDNTAAGATTIPWAVNLKVDLAAVQAELGTSSPTEAQFWYAFTIGHACCTPVIDIVPFHWPATATPFDLTSNPTTPVFPTTGWGSLKLGVTDPSCTGVRISWSDIGTTNTPPSQIRNDANNTFRATPNWATVPIAADLIQARFRVADWGSQVGVNGNWLDVPGGSAVPNLASGVLEFTCNQGGPAPACVNYVAPADHQCMLVELIPKGASGISFLQDSAYRNMDFVPASVFERTAKIDIKGAAAFPGGATEREVHIYVKTMNMPAHATGPQGVVTDKQRERTGPERSPYEQATDALATYEVHVYHDTGKRSTVNGKEVRQFEAQVPFGYFVKHEGALEGWRHSLEALNGVTLTELSPNYFKVNVPEGGSILVKSTIEALEPVKGPGKVPPCRCNCELPGQGNVDGTSAAFGIGLLGAAFGLRRKLRRQRLG